jgi:hypothetical protein
VTGLDPFCYLPYLPYLHLPYLHYLHYPTCASNSLTSTATATQLGKKRLKVQVKRDQDDGEGEGEGEDFDEGGAEALFTGSTSEMASGNTTSASTPHHAYCSRSNSHGSMDSLPSVDSRPASSLDAAAEWSEASIEEGAEAEEFELKGK